MGAETVQRNRQGRIEAYTPSAQRRGPGLRGAQKEPGAYQSRARCAWRKKEGKKGKKRKDVLILTLRFQLNCIMSTIYVTLR